MSQDCTTIYILFKEYADESRPSSMCLIQGESFNINDTNAINCLINKAIIFFEYFEYEIVQYLYDINNLNGLLYQTTILNEYHDYPEYPNNIVTVVSLLQKYGATDWTDSGFHVTANNEVITKDGLSLTNTILGDMAKRILTNNEKQPSVLLSIEALNHHDGKIVVSHQYNGNVSLKIVDTIKDLHSWLSKKRYPERQYDFNPKHGDKDHSSQYLNDGSGRKAAHLETNALETKELLKLAIGKDKNSALWFWDKDRNKHIYFENQNEKRLAFHAYHLTEGDPNFKNINLSKLKQIGACQQ